MANSRPMGVNRVQLSDLCVDAASVNKNGAYLTLSGTIYLVSPEARQTFRGRVQFPVHVPATAHSEPFAPSEQVQDDDASGFLQTLIPTPGACITLQEMYHRYMAWGGLATRSRFHAVLRRDFSKMLVPEDGNYTPGAKMVIKHYAPREAENGQDTASRRGV